MVSSLAFELSLFFGRNNRTLFVLPGVPFPFMNGLGVPKPLIRKHLLGLSSFRTSEVCKLHIYQLAGLDCLRSSPFRKRRICDFLVWREYGVWNQPL